LGAAQGCEAQDAAEATNSMHGVGGVLRLQFEEVAKPVLLLVNNDFNSFRSLAHFCLSNPTGKEGTG
jgi:hypothetical protein